MNSLNDNIPTTKTIIDGLLHIEKAIPKPKHHHKKVVKPTPNTDGDTTTDVVPYEAKNDEPAIPWK